MSFANLFSVHYKYMHFAVHMEEFQNSEGLLQLLFSHHLRLSDERSVSAAFDKKLFALSSVMLLAMIDVGRDKYVVS